MKIFGYDIWDGDKGIIFAESEGKAKMKFKKEYPDVKIADEDYESGMCSIDEICEYNGGEKLVYLWN